MSNTVISDLLLRFILAAIILLVGIVIARIAGKVIHRLLHEIELNKLVKNATRTDIPIEDLASKAVVYIIYFFTIVMALNQLGITSFILYIISVGIIVVIIISFVLGVRDFIPNMFAGLNIQKKGFLKEGDNIEFQGTKGKVQRINLVETSIKTRSGDLISIPNSVLIKNVVKKKR